MQWLNKIVDELLARKPNDEILIESGASPSGSYHFGALREAITCHAIVTELKNRGHKTKHVHFVDDFDALRKVPVNLPAGYEKFLGVPLFMIPAPEGNSPSYADYFLSDFLASLDKIGVDYELTRNHQEYERGDFTQYFEIVLNSIDKVRKILEEVSGRQLDPNWSPIQVLEDGRLKNRKFISIDKKAKTITYQDPEGNEKSARYDNGGVKLDWRIYWPSRWAYDNVDAEPFGRDHATKGGSYDTGAELAKELFNIQPPLPVPYDFVNLAGDTKKMSASKGTGVNAVDVVKILPPEIVRFFMLRFPPSKRLYFDPINIAQLIDEFAQLMVDEPDSQLIQICRTGLNPVVSSVPFSHLVASYQSALKDPVKTIEIIRRTEHAEVAGAQKEIIERELAYIDQWLNKWAPDDVKFKLSDQVDVGQFNEAEKAFLKVLAVKIKSAPDDADGEWFHKAVYDLKDSSGLEPKQMFTTLYRALIDKDAGPRAGWFLSILPRDWLIKRLNLEA